MSRILLEFVLPLLLPSLAYFAWLTWDRRRTVALGAGAPRAWADAPWPWLLGSGVLLVVGIAHALSIGGGETMSGIYVPPLVEDGRIVAGHVEPQRH